jgi:hypothetical protein
MEEHTGATLGKQCADFRSDVLVLLNPDHWLCAHLHIYPAPLDVVMGPQLSRCREQTLSESSGKLYAESCMPTSENTPSRTLVNKGNKMGRGRKKPGPEKWGPGGLWKEQDR